MIIRFNLKNVSFDSFSASLQFSSDRYKEIVLSRQFDLQNLIGNAGGYVGICVGYSFLQLPKSITMIVLRIKSYIGYKWKHQLSITLKIDSAISRVTGSRKNICKNCKNTDAYITSSIIFHIYFNLLRFEEIDYGFFVLKHITKYNCWQISVLSSYSTQINVNSYS